MNRQATIVAAFLAASALAGCERQQNEGWLGYAEGEVALIAPPQPGWLLDVAVMRGA